MAQGKVKGVMMEMVKLSAPPKRQSKLKIKNSFNSTFAPVNKGDNIKLLELKLIKCMLSHPAFILKLNYSSLS